MKVSRRRNIAITVVLLVLAALAAPFIHFPGRRVGNAMARALGRPVTVGSASLRLLPQPAIELQNVTIGEDPAFGAEPIMAAPAVVATLRLSSVWRGRLDFGSVSFQESGGVAPSFNLVRRADGEWNIASLMARAGSSPVAPTAARKLEPKPHFPYIELASGRVNFKADVEKKVVALTDADFSLWLASDHEWRARLKARPIRTDTNLSDTGIIEAEGTVRRASQSDGMTVQLDARLRGSQLGQLSALLYGRDRGWRGATDAELIIAGTLEKPAVELRARIDDFRRFDITSPQPLKLEAACSAQLDPAREALDNLRCTAPYGDGTVAVTGKVSDLSKRSYQLALDLEGVPVNRVLALVRRAKRDLPLDLAAQGFLDAQLTASRESRAEPGTWAGHATIRRLMLQSGATALRFPTIAVAVGQDGLALDENRGFLMTAQPFPLDMGGEKPAILAAQFDSAGYSFSVSGPASIESTLRAARLVGMRAPTYDVRGAANLQLLVAGVWAGFAPPVITGTAQISNASAGLAGIHEPLRIASAQVELTQSAAALRQVTASLGVGGPSFSGSIQVPRGCAHPEECWAQVDLKMAELNLSNAAATLSPAARHPWYDVFNETQNPESLLMRARARGRINISKLHISRAEATDVGAEVVLDRGRLQLNNVGGRAFGGQHSGEWQADFTGAEPHYSGQGAVAHVAMGRLGFGFTDACCTGTGELSYHARLAGHTAADLAHSALVQADFAWKDGMLNRFGLPVTSAARLPQTSPASALRFTSFRGHIELVDATIQLTRSKIAGPSGIYQVSGTVSFDRRLAMTLASASQRYMVAGTLDDPVIATDAQRAAAPAVAVPAPTPAAPKSGPGTD